MKKRITIQDIADELGLSRNTISKAINGTGCVASDTKDLIFQKATELGYKQFSLLQNPDCEGDKIISNREIALFTKSVPGSQYLSSTLLDSFQKKISTLGYRLTIYVLRDAIVSSCSLPENFNIDSTDAILIQELFDEAYTDFLCKLDIPTLFVDSFANPGNKTIDSDILYMENKSSSYHLVTHLLNTGCKKIGYIGDYLHCQSFFERWCGYKEAAENSCRNYRDFCILENDASPYNDSSWLASKIQALKELPDAFFCANDFLAVCTVKALKLLNYSLPADIKVAGFDNSPESQIIEPQLTTVSIKGKDMGYIATNLLLNRIKYPNSPFTVTYTRTDIVYRASTETVS